MRHLAPFAATPLAFALPALGAGPAAPAGGTRVAVTEIVVKEYRVNTPLPLGTPVSVTSTPTRAGPVRFACAMDMVGGVVVVH